MLLLILTDRKKKPNNFISPSKVRRISILLPVPELQNTGQCFPMSADFFQ